MNVSADDPHWKHLVKSCMWTHVSCNTASSWTGAVSFSGAKSASEDKKKNPRGRIIGPDGSEPGPGLELNLVRFLKLNFVCSLFSGHAFICCDERSRTMYCNTHDSVHQFVLEHLVSGIRRVRAETTLMCELL